MIKIITLIVTLIITLVVQPLLLVPSLILLRTRVIVVVDKIHIIMVLRTVILVNA